MQKNGMLLIALMVISIGFLSGCTESSNDSNEIDYSGFDYGNVEFELYADYTGSGSIGWGGIDVRFDFMFPSQYFDYGTMDGCEIKELNYVVYGNGHYVGGEKITELDGGGNTLTSQAFGSFRGRIEVFDYNTSTYPNTKVWLIYIHPELKSAMENETTIKWTASGEMSFYTPEDAEYGTRDLIKVPFEDLTYYQTEF